MRSSQRRVAAQVDLYRGREPAQGQDISSRYDKRGLRKIVFGGNRSKRAVGQPIVEQDHGRGISAKHPARESVNLVERQLHVISLTPALR